MCESTHGFAVCHELPWNIGQWHQRWQQLNFLFLFNLKTRNNGSKCVEYTGDRFSDESVETRSNRVRLFASSAARPQEMSQLWRWFGGQSGAHGSQIIFHFRPTPAFRKINLRHYSAERWYLTKDVARISRKLNRFVRSFFLTVAIDAVTALRYQSGLHQFKEYKKGGMCSTRPKAKRYRYFKNKVPKPYNALKTPTWTWPTDSHFLDFFPWPIVCWSCLLD